MNRPVAMLENAGKYPWICVLAFLLLSQNAGRAMVDQILQVPFRYSADGNAMLMHARINDKTTLLILDMNSPHTTLRAGLFETKAQQPAKGVGSGTESTEEVSLQIGSWKSPKCKVIVKDLSERLSRYQERIDGILGLDFFKEFSQVTINLKNQTITFVMEDSVPTGSAKSSSTEGGRLSFENLRNLTIEGGNGHYRINEVDLTRANDNPTLFSTQDHHYQLRVTQLKTVRLSQGRPIESSDKPLLDNWARSIPLLANKLKEQDALASMEPVVYDLTRVSGQERLYLQEEIVVLWTTNPADIRKIEHPRLMPPVLFPGEQLVDIQYRGLRRPAEHLFGQIVLQVLYIRSEGGPAELLGAFMIVSNPRGDFEFYALPARLLEQILSLEPDEISGTHPVLATPR